MPRLTEVSEDLKESSPEIVFIEPFEAELETPAVLPPQSQRQLPEFLTRIRRARAMKAKYRAALDLVRAAASSNNEATFPIEDRKYRLRSAIGRFMFGGYLVVFLLISPFVIAGLFPWATPTVTLLLFGAAFLYTLIAIRLSKLPEKKLNAALALLDYPRALRILSAAERYGFASFVPARADVLLGAGKFSEAEHWLRSGLLGTKRKRRLNDLYRYGCALQGLGQNEHAEGIYAFAAEMLPGGESLIALADMLLKRRGSPLDVLDLLEAGLKRVEEPSVEFLALYHARVAWAMTRLNEFEEADRLLARSFEAIPQISTATHARLLLFRAEILLDRGRRTDAASGAKQCLALDPDGPTHGDARLILVAASLRVSEHRQQPAAAHR